MKWVKRLLLGASLFYVGGKVNTARNNHREWILGGQKPVRSRRQ